MFAQVNGKPVVLDGRRWRDARPDDHAPAFDIAGGGPGPDGRPTLTAVRTRAGETRATTDRGAYRKGPGGWRPLEIRRAYVAHQVMPDIDMVIRAVVQDPSGHVWLATDRGAYLTDGAEWWHPLDHRDGMPYVVMNCLRVAPNGDLWGGTNEGGWLAECTLRVPGSPGQGIVPHPSDNDGLWTAMYVAAESFRFAVDRSPEARACARKSMEALLDLVRSSGYPGYPARAIIRKGETVSGYDPGETVRVEGETDRIWFTSPTHPGVQCKGDTSSDALDGPYSAWFVYHELVASPEERWEIARICRSVTDNLLQHDYTLVGHTGRKTRWGVFGPPYRNEDPRWVEERGLNSLEVLCYLKVAAHICGDAHFSSAYEELIAKHHYLINTVLYRRQAAWHAANFSDDELAYCVYYPLLCLEQRPERRTVLLAGLATTWQGLRDEKRAWFNVQYAALSGADGRLGAAVECLQDWPWELTDWAVRNSHRHGVELRIPRGGRGAWLTRVLPFSELRIMRWSGNPFEPDGGGNGSSEDDGGAWPLAYWMARHHGLILH